MATELEILATTFGESELNYKEAQGVWFGLWSRISANAVSDWRAPWHADIPGWFEGNPIFSAISEKHRLGIRVIVHEPVLAAEDLLVHWIDQREMPDGRMAELVIDCTLSRQALLEAEALIGAWIYGDLHLISQPEAVATMSSSSFTSLPTRVQLAA